MAFFFSSTERKNQRGPDYKKALIRRQKHDNIPVCVFGVNFRALSPEFIDRWINDQYFSGVSRIPARPAPRSKRPPGRKFYLNFNIVILINQL